jgi:hypothetical protein
LNTRALTARPLLRKDGLTTLGGLAAVNLGSISSSFVSVAVGGLNVANLQAGGLVGNNSGTILSSVVTGNVQTGDGSIAGGLVASNSVSGAITGSQVSGNVTVGADSAAGGLVGANAGAITGSTASGAVSSAGANSIIGGLAGASIGVITDSIASGAVTSTGADSTVGGLVGANAGTIANSTASGAVTSTGADSTVGALVGTSTGIITNSVGLGVVTGGVPSAPNLPPIPPIIPGCSDPLCGLLNILTPATATLPAGLLNVLLPATATLPGAAFFESLPGPTQVINNLVGIGPTQLAALNPTAPPVFESVQGGIRLPPQQPALPAQGGQQQQLPSSFNRRVIDIPPSTETRFVKDEVVLQIAGNVTVERLQAAVGRLGLILLASENLAITGSTLARFHITNGRSPAEIIRVLAAIQLVAVAQPNYVYTLQQQGEETAPAARGDTGPKGDPAQYILEKLKISDVHRMVRGTNIPIAVIDSEIDAAHPDLEGVIAQRFSAVGAPEKPHSHGTGMAGAIASHQRLLGTAPAARLLAVHAFSTTANADSTTFSILKGVDWSVRERARIINMSFACSAARRRRGRSRRARNVVAVGGVSLSEWSHFESASGPFAENWLV